MTQKEKYDAYLVCLVRGHDNSGYRTASIPSWITCKHCGVQYHYKTTLIEMPSSIPTKEDDGTPS